MGAILSTDPFHKVDGAGSRIPRSIFDKGHDTSSQGPLDESTNQGAPQYFASQNGACRLLSLHMYMLRVLVYYFPWYL